MKFMEFIDNVKTSVEQRLGPQYTIRQEDVLKNNGKRLYGLSIRRDICDVAPIIYMEGFYTAYKDGEVKLPSITDKVIAVYHESMDLIAKV